MTPRMRAWRNMLVAGVNAGLAQGAFTLSPGPVRKEPYDFTFDGMPALAHAQDIGLDEIRLNVVVEPTDKGAAFIHCGCPGQSLMPEYGAAMASGWLRRDGAARLEGRGRIFCRQYLNDRLAFATVEPNGFAIEKKKSRG